MKNGSSIITLIENHDLSLTEPAQISSKAELHKKKIMLLIWWDFKGVMYFELLPRNQTINLDVYYQQLMKLEEAIKEKRPELVNRKGIVFHHDNARPHIFGYAAKIIGA